MASRPGGSRRGARDGGKDDSIENDYLNRVIEAVRKAKEYNDESSRLGVEIIALEDEIKTKGHSTPEQHRKLDELYRKKLRCAEAEKKVHDEEGIIDNIAILAAVKSTDEPAPRGGHGPKSRNKSQKPIIESDVSVDSQGTSPAESKDEKPAAASTNSRVDVLKRGKSNTQTQRSSSVASQGRPAVAKDKDGSATPVASTPKDAAKSSLQEGEQHKGQLAEAQGTLTVGTEVFYRFSKNHPSDLGVGIQCVIKKIWPERRPIGYDVQDPEPDQYGKQNVHKATAKDLYPIPAPGDALPTKEFVKDAVVFARYPDTDTFYKAKVTGLTNGKTEYRLIFEGEEGDREQSVERRFVISTTLR